jgi:hypothetical protein
MAGTGSLILLVNTIFHQVEDHQDDSAVQQVPSRAWNTLRKDSTRLQIETPELQWIFLDQLRPHLKPQPIAKETW